MHIYDVQSVQSREVIARVIWDSILGHINIGAIVEQ